MIYANYVSTGVIERLAALEHERWSNYIKYMLSKCPRDEQGNVTIPYEYVNNLEKLAHTNYSLLSEPQKQLDRDEVYKYLKLLQELT